MCWTALCCPCKCKHSVLCISTVTYYLCYFEISLRHCSCLIHDNCFYRCKWFKRNTALEQNSFFRTCTYSCKESKRYTKNKCTRTAYYKKSKCRVYPVMPVSRYKWRDNRRSQSRKYNDRCIYSCKFAYKSINLRFWCRRIFNRFKNTAYHRLFQNFLNLYIYNPRHIYTARNNFTSLFYPYRNRLTRYRRSINAAVTLDDNTVKRYSIARSYLDNISNLYFLRVKFYYIVSVYISYNLWTHINCFHNLFAALSDCNILKKLANLIKQHNSYCLRIFTRCKCTDCCDAHKEVFIKNFSSEKIFNSL